MGLLEKLVEVAEVTESRFNVFEVDDVVTGVDERRWVNRIQTYRLDTEIPDIVETTDYTCEVYEYQ